MVGKWKRDNKEAGENLNRVQGQVSTASVSSAGIVQHEEVKESEEDSNSQLSQANGKNVDPMCFIGTLSPSCQPEVGKEIDVDQNHVNVRPQANEGNAKELDVDHDHGNVRPQANEGNADSMCTSVRAMFPMCTLPPTGVLKM